MKPSSNTKRMPNAAAIFEYLRTQVTFCFTLLYQEAPAPDYRVYSFGATLDDKFGPALVFGRGSNGPAAMRHIVTRLLEEPEP